MRLEDVMTVERKRATGVVEETTMKGGMMAVRMRHSKKYRLNVCVDNVSSVACLRLPRHLRTQDASGFPFYQACRCKRGAKPPMSGFE